MKELQLTTLDLQMFAEGEVVDDNGTTNEQDSIVENTDEPTTEEVVDTKPDFELGDDGIIHFKDDEKPEEVTEDSEQSEQPQDKPVTYKVKINGEVEEKSIDELIAGYQRQRDYTTKTQELARQREELEQLRTQKDQTPDTSKVEVAKPNNERDKLVNMSKKAMQMAHADLGLDDEEPINEYDPLHIAAYQNAIFKLQQKDFKAQQVQHEYTELLSEYKVKEPEHYPEIDAYAHYRLTQEMPRAESDKILMAIESGKMGVVRDFIEDTRTKWYEKNMPQETKPVVKSKTPPKVESAGNGVVDSSVPKTRDMSAIRGKSMDEVVAQLNKWGLVK